MRQLKLAALVAAFLLVVPAGASPLAGDPSVPVGAVGRWQTLAGERVDTLSIARRHLGTNPTGKRSLWCADFANLIERKVGRAGTGSRMARAFLAYGTPVRLPQARAGDIVVLGRGRQGGHVGYFVSRSGGTVRLISGNACRPRRVCESAYPASRILGIRRP